MVELREVFEMVTRQIEPDTESWRELERRQRRTARNRRRGALAVAALIVAAFALFATKAFDRSERGTTPATVEPKGPGIAFTVVGLDGSIRSSIRALPGTATPDISPDGTMVAFTTTDRTVPQIASMRLDGTGFRVLTNDPIGAKQPRWSPDGSQLLYFRVDREGNLRLMVMNADGTNVREVPGTHQTADFNPADWSPNGSVILYSSFKDGVPILATLPVAGGRTHFLNRGSGHIEVGGAWSPDGSSIAFTRDNGPVFQVWAMNADGSGERLLAALPVGNAEAPAWSPDGTKVAFIGTASGIFGGGGVLYVVDVATGDVTRILQGTATGRRHEDRPNWLPGGRTLLVMTEVR